jgi:hypothetical protein
MLRSFFDFRCGTTRRVALIGTVALKFPKGRIGKQSNRVEVRTWLTATPKCRELLCPIIWHLPFGILVVMRRAAPMTEEDAQKRRDRLDKPGGFPDFNSDCGLATEGSASNWGYLDGRSEPVAIDYGLL